MQWKSITDEGEYSIFPFFFRLFRWLFRNKTNTGESNNSNKINKIANYLNCSVDYLLGRVDNSSPKNYNENPSLNNNTIKILGRDGTNIEKTLTDDEIEVFKKLISSLPDAEDL